MKRNEALQQILDYFEENKDVFAEVLEDLDSWNGYLGDDRVYSMDELDELYHDADTTEILRRAFYGYDADTWTTDAHGEKTYGAFNPNRDYFYFNGYGNLVSTDWKEYEDQLDKWTIEAMNDNRVHLYSLKGNAELEELFDTLDESEED